MATSVVLFITGCAADSAPSVVAEAVCPPEYSFVPATVAPMPSGVELTVPGGEPEQRSLSMRVAAEIEAGSQEARDTGYQPRFPGSNAVELVRGPVYFWVPTPLLFQAAQWAETHPGCFSDEARVRVYALRDRAAATAEAGIGVLRVESDEYGAVLAALRAS